MPVRKRHQYYKRQQKDANHFIDEKDDKDVSICCTPYIKNPAGYFQNHILAKING
jgi:hypothetical protein